MTANPVANFADYKKDLEDLHTRFQYNKVVGHQLMSRAMSLERAVRGSVLILLAISLFTESRPPAANGFSRYRTGLLVSLSNPKAILFCMALFPQFIDRRQPLAAQAGILLATFVVIETCWMLVYAGGGARLAAWLRKGNRMRWFNRASGGVFMGAGVLLGSLRR